MPGFDREQLEKVEAVAKHYGDKAAFAVRDELVERIEKLEKLLAAKAPAERRETRKK